MATFVALVDVATKGGRAAKRNIPERSFLLSAERISKPSQISRTMEAENIGQLGRRHEAAIGSPGKANRSNGLTVAHTARLARCRYLAVVLRLRCPIRI